ncbi:MAG: YtxH domain-containing protein [Bacteroidia bacterium]|nr:YtxH domain-containing protein [Bacteroidia bacterium]MBT8310725.1 YtxH domain-containing protein [Bacteroidia bacterium]NNK27319.1 YtxH domain-containing protein [Flavobacteriaceae bacterium]NNL61837.1 YtxH domain-containing protein [Flavobacteriaceae bacterium]RZV64261.1 MAG: YtxH domain-containing protein [Flavobacteriaceae bacterium]
MIINKGTIALGILAGAALGILLAPDKGSVTREKLKKEARDIKTQFVNDAKEVKEDLKKTAKSGKETLEKGIEDFASKASYKTENVITFLEKHLALLKKKNKKYQSPTA